MLSTFYQHEQKIQQLEHEIQVLEAKLKKEPEKRKNHSSTERDKSDSLYDFIVPWQI
jgi:Skp family chaperone for outer membrane proteins